MRPKVSPRSGLRRGSLITGLFVIGMALAQPAGDLNNALTGLASPDMVKRAVGFESLLSPTRQAFASVPAEVHALLRQHPDEADSIRTALIEALEMEASYREGLERSGQQMTEAFSDYWSNLMWAVGTLRDPRATKGLLGGIDTGGIAVNALADLCPASADALIERTRQPDRTFHGEVIRQRQAAMSALARLSQNGGVFLTQRAACLIATHFRC